MKLIKTKKLKKTITAFLAVIMLLALCSVSAFAAPTAPTPTTANVIIKGATAGDTFSAYKLVDITYDATTNTLAYAWTAEVQALLTAKSDTTTVEQFAALDETARQAFIAGITNDLLTNNATPVKTGVVAGADTKATFEALPWGEYLIVPTLTTSVYQIMIGVIQPTGDGTDWTVANSDELDVKKTDGPTVAKTASETNVGTDTTITYTLEFDVPTYDSTVTDKTFSITDVASASLKYAENLKIYGSADGGVNYTELTIAGVTNSAKNAIPAKDAAGYTLTLDINYDALKTAVAGCNKVKVTYNAAITDTAALNTGIDNDVTLTYSNYPYVSGSHETSTDTETVKTYGIKIFAYDKNTTEETTFDGVTGDTGVKELPDAKFDLYRPAVEGDDAADIVKLPGTDIDVVLVKTGLETGEDGYVTADRIPAGDYYLVETTAPSGYNIITGSIDITDFTEDAVDEDGYYGVLAPHNSGITLPQTGGTGTTIFTITGIILMAAAVILLVVLKKKKVHSK